MSDSLTINNRSRPTSIDINKEIHGKRSQRNSMEIKNNAPLKTTPASSNGSSNRSRPNSSEIINGHANTNYPEPITMKPMATNTTHGGTFAAATNINAYTSRRTAVPLSEVRRSVSMDPKEETFFSSNYNQQQPTHQQQTTRNRTELDYPLPPFLPPQQDERHLHHQIPLLPPPLPAPLPHQHHHHNQLHHSQYPPPPQQYHLQHHQTPHQQQIHQQHQHLHHYHLNGHEANVDVMPETRYPSSCGGGGLNYEPASKCDRHDVPGSPGGDAKSQADTSTETSTEPADSTGGGSTVTATASTVNGITRTVVCTAEHHRPVFSATPCPAANTAAATLSTATCLAPPPKSAKYEIIAVRERHGLFRKAVPCMPVSVAVVFCILNVITPGVGTLAAGFTVLCGCPTEHGNKAKSLMYNIVAAILQLVTAPFVIGWVWSIMWGVTFVNVSVSKDETIVTAHV